MFSIDIQPFGTGRKIVARDRRGFGMEVLPDFGAALNALWFPDFYQERFVNVVDGYATAEELSHEPCLFKGVILFPFPNRTKDGQWMWEDEQHQFPINEPNRNHALHGLLHNRAFEVTELMCTDEMAAVNLSYTSDGEDIGFPFFYKVEVHYTLTDVDGLTIKTSVSNLDRRSFPFGLGWHPYFHLGNNVDQLKLKLPYSQLLETDSRLIPTGQKSNFNRFSSSERIGNAHFDSGFELLPEKASCLELSDESTSMRLRIALQPSNDGFAFYQIYTTPDRKAIALEPMTMAANALQTRSSGFSILEPKTTVEHTFHIGY